MSPEHVSPGRPPAGARALAPPCLRRHARRVRHATDKDLDHIEELLAELRTLPQFRERKRGEAGFLSQVRTALWPVPSDEAVDRS